MTTNCNSWGWLLASTLLLGCGSPSGPTASSAEARIKAELDKWLAGSESKATTFEARSNLHDLPIGYKVRAVTSTEPRVPTDVVVKYPEALDDAGPGFRVVVDVDFKSEAGTPLTKVIEYNVTWISQMNDWAIEERP